MNILHAVGWGLLGYIITLLILCFLNGVLKSLSKTEGPILTDEDRRIFKVWGLLTALAVFLLTL